MKTWFGGVRVAVSLVVFSAVLASAGPLPVGEGVAMGAVDEPADRLARTKITIRGNDLPLMTVLNQIARSAHLALVVDKEVRQDLKVPAVDLDGAHLNAALAVLLTPMGYSYVVEPERSFLRVFVYAISTFKLSMPVVVQNWSTGITNGGDAAATTGATASGGLGARVALSTHSDTDGLWDEVEKSLSRMLGMEQTAGGAKEAGPPRPDLGSYSVNRVAGFVTVRALPSVMPSIDAYFQALESEMGRSITVEVKVMQVDLLNQKAGGIDWNMASLALGPLFIEGGSSLAATATSSLFNGQTAGANAPFVRISGRAGEAFVKALEQQGTVKVLAQPTMALGNNLPALIELAGLTSYVDQVTTTVVGQGASQTSVRTATVSDGLIMSMMPRVLDGGEVSIALGLVLQEVLGIENFTFQGGAVQLPSTARRSYSGVVRARLNETLVLGGLITSRKEDRSKGLPALSQIPIIGILFGQKEGSERKSELIITLTPREVRSVKAAPVAPRLEPSVE